MSESVQLALVSGVVAIATAVISNWDKIFRPKGRVQVQAKTPFRFGWAVFGALLAAALTYGYQRVSGDGPLPADLVARCDYRFAEPRPPASMSNKINDGLLWYSSKVECDRLDPRHRQVLVEASGSETSKSFLDNYAVGDSEERGDGRRYYSVVFHMPQNDTGLRRYAEFYWPGISERVKVTQEP